MVIVYGVSIRVRAFATALEVLSADETSVNIDV